MTSNASPDPNSNQIDPNVAASKPIPLPVPKPKLITDLPPAHAVTTTRHGTSYWATTNTARIILTLPDKSIKSYFLKTLTKDLGKNILYGEYTSMQEIHRVVPDFAPKPIAWGTYQNDLETHFFLCEYRDMVLARDEMPDPGRFTESLAALHQRSQTLSLEGKFGFHVPTYSGYLPQYTGWERSWEVFFSKSLRVALDLEIKAKGHDSAFDVLVPVVFEKIIPRLLRPLESEGRSVKPALVHGDLWYGNSGVDRVSGECLVFDACCFYAHHEYEFGQWMPACNRFGEEYRAAYREFVKPSPPEEDYDGRLDLYKL
ncbi:hypothetical protein SI65_06567 [Aspergillus cristatus]|uniref:protein-ribulosamine 3-kinase n=1 Tax=Aspergillus cristatus TaxID=573508 RepID=A0A1E3BA13_ASPCR|nr:hypothetical protein SI65_06567 [Aspergillus cristatus]